MHSGRYYISCWFLLLCTWKCNLSNPTRVIGLHKKHCSIYTTLWQLESCFRCVLLMIPRYFTVSNLCSFLWRSWTMSLPGAVPCPSVFHHTFIHFRPSFCEWDGFVLKRALISRAQPSSHLCAFCPRQAELLHLDGQIAIRVLTPFIKTAWNEPLSSLSQPSFN